MKLDWTINLGTLIQFGGMVIAVFAMYVRVEKRFTSLETKMEMLMDWFKGETLTRVVRTETVHTTERGKAL